MEELYKVMDDLLEVEFQMKAGMDILKELEYFPSGQTVFLYPFFNDINSMVQRYPERTGRVLYAGKRNRKIGC